MNMNKQPAHPQQSGLTPNRLLACRMVPGTTKLLTNLVTSRPGQAETIILTSSSRAPDYSVERKNPKTGIYSGGGGSSLA